MILPKPAIITLWFLFGFHTLTILLAMIMAGRDIFSFAGAVVYASALGTISMAARGLVFEWRAAR